MAYGNTPAPSVPVHRQGVPGSSARLPSISTAFLGFGRSYDIKTPTAPNSVAQSIDPLLLSTNSAFSGGTPA